MTDAKGRPLHISITAGQRHEAIKAEELVGEARGAAFIGDTGYDSNRIRDAIEAKGMLAVIHSRPERKEPRPLDRELYKRRYLVEVFFHHLKRFRGVATRYEKTARNYLALVHLACARLWLG